MGTQTTNVRASRGSAAVAAVVAPLGAVVVRAVAGTVVVVAALHEVAGVLVAVAEEGVALAVAVAEGRRDVVALRVGPVDGVAPSTLVLSAHCGCSSPENCWNTERLSDGIAVLPVEHHRTVVDGTSTHGLCWKAICKIRCPTVGAE